MNEKVEKRIKELKKYTEEMGEWVNEHSLSLFYIWVELIDDVIQDKLSITLTPDNEIYVNYNLGSTRYCIRFLEDDLIKLFVMEV